MSLGQNQEFFLTFISFSDLSKPKIYLRLWLKRKSTLEPRSLYYKTAFQMTPVQVVLRP